MRSDPKSATVFTEEIIKLRMYSNTLRKDYHDKIINWIDKIPLANGETGEALTFVLPTRGCKYATAKHGGCSMCTLPTDNPLNPTSELLASLPEKTMNIFERKGGKERFSGVKFYTSGSYIDRWELPVEIREEILSKFVDLVDEITIETRCEYVIKKNIESMLKVVPAEKLIVAIGQETTNDEINKRAINKGHTFKQFSRAVNLLHEYGITVKGYILLKPVFVSELTAIDDAIQSARDMKELGIEMISINPSYIGKATLMEKLFKQRNYTPPWLWSVYHVTKQIKTIVGDGVRVIADPVAAGSERGPRNCGSCDREMKSSLKAFSADQNLDKLLNETPKCDCEEIYHHAITSEHLSNGLGNSFHF